MITIMTPGQNAWKDEQMARRAGGMGAGTLAVALSLLVSGMCWHTPAVMASPPSAPPFGSELRGPLKGHTRGITALAIGERSDGTRVIVSAGFDKTLRMWSLDTGKLIGKPWWGHYSGVMDIEVTKRADGSPVFVTGSTDARMRIWNLDTREPIGKPLNACSTCMVYGMAIAKRGDGQRVVISAEVPDLPLAEGSPPASLRIRSLESGRPLGEPLTHEGNAHHPFVVTTKDGDGTPVIVSGGTDHNVVVRNLDTGRPLSGPFTGHTDNISALAVGAREDGTPVVVSGSLDTTIRIWSLA
ncbi:hypothetical protein AB0G05_01450 [Nonomuraea wenchangensis]